jgi:hypothetical protein
MNRILSVVCFTFFTALAHGHYLWLETQSTGQLGILHHVRVHYGEYTYGVTESVEGEAFPAVANFKLWLLGPDGGRKPLTAIPSSDHYAASFLPDQAGTYTVMLGNSEIDVIDYTQYDFGVFKTHYQATARVQVGGEPTDTISENPHGLTLQRLTSGPDTVRLQVLYKDKPHVGAEVKVYVSDLWSKTLETDEDGKVSFALPWQTTYIAETTKKEEIPGTYKGKDYDFIWHCATFCIKN